MTFPGALPAIRPLVPISKGANYTATPGDWVECSTALTITLPDTPVTGSLVGIEALGGTVTVNRGGSNAIQVPIGASVNTITMPNNRQILLIFDGSQWRAIGSYPLQWVALPFSTGWQAFETPTPGVNYPIPGYSRDADGIVRLRGPVTKTTTITLGSQIALLPTGFRPAREQWFPVEAEFGTGNRAAFMLQICGSGSGVNGSVNIFDQSGNAPSGGGFPGTYVFLDPIAFEGTG